MTLASEVETIGGLLKKHYESGPAKEQFVNNITVLNRIKQRRNELVGAGNTVTIGLHVGRSPGISAAANGAATPTAGKQTYNQTTISLKFLYGATQFTNPDILASKKNAGAFANVMEANMTGMLNDMRWDAERQLFADGSGILAFCTGDASTVTQGIEPYLWAPANKYLDIVGLPLQIRAISDAATSQLTADARATASIVASTTSSTVVAAVDRTATSADGDAIGKYGSIFLSNGTSIDDYEMMGLHGGIHNTDPIGSTAWKYDAGDYGNTAVTNFTGPEGQAHDWAVGSLTRTFQGLATASYNWWKSTVYGNGGVPRALDYALLDKMLGTLRVTQGGKISAIYTTWQVQQKLIDLMRADRRYTGEKMKIDGGLQTESYAGIPIIVADACPRGTMFFVDESELSFYVGKDFHFVDVNGSPMEKIAGYDGYAVTGALYANLGFHNRQKHGKIIDILES